MSDAAKFGAGSLTDVLLKKVRDETSLDVKRADFKLDMLPAHLFMTFRVVAKRKDGGAPVDALGMERYFFRDGLILLKDAYWKRIGAE